ncbi:beta-ketoacyl synthase domain protein [Burkholderia pseudomallei MSHR435]|nr:beta-ketoacyl synthase domain protein [Burkholderia pseudomallei MSHR435]
MRLPATASAQCPARSIASQASSSRIRCCGSIVATSFGDSRNRPASNDRMSSRKPPRSIPRWRAPGSISAGHVQRSPGSSPTTQAPAFSASQNASGVSSPPGSRHAMPTIAMPSGANGAACAGSRAAPGSVAGHPRDDGRAAAAAAPAVSQPVSHPARGGACRLASKYATMRAGVLCWNRNVAGSATPHRSASASASSSRPTESSPSCISGRSRA